MNTVQMITYEQHEKEVGILRNEIEFLKEQIEWFKRQIFGKRSEKVVSDLNSAQMLFEGFENLPASGKEKKKTVAAHARRKPNRNGQDKITLPPDLPVKTTLLDISEEEKVCPETGEPLVLIGVEVSHKLAHEPSSYYIKEIVRPKYANPKKEEAGIITAELPDSPQASQSIDNGSNGNDLKQYQINKRRRACQIMGFTKV